MSRTLSTGTIGRELRADVDYFFYGETVPSNTTSSSEGLLIGKVQSALEIVGVAKTEMTIADTKAISFIVQTSSDDGVADAYATVATPYSLTASGVTTVAAGTELFRYLLTTDSEIYARVGFVSTDVGESGTVDVFPTYISR